MPLVNHVREMSKNIALDIDAENCNNYTAYKEEGENLKSGETENETETEPF